MQPAPLPGMHLCSLSVAMGLRMGTLDINKSHPLVEPCLVLFVHFNGLEPQIFNHSLLPEKCNSPLNCLHQKVSVPELRHVAKLQFIHSDSEQQMIW